MILLPKSRENQEFPVIFGDLGILLEFLLTAGDVSAGRWQESRTLDLENMVKEEKLELTDCTWEGDSILSTDANAMMIFHGTENWGQIQLTFNEPVLGPATTEWYNSPSEDDRFDRFRRQEGYIMPGKEIGIYDGVLIGAGGAALAVSAGSFTDLLVCPVVCSSFLGDRSICSRCFIRKVKGY